MTSIVPNATITNVTMRPMKKPVIQYLNSIIPNCPFLFIEKMIFLGFIKLSFGVKNNYLSLNTASFIYNLPTLYLNLTIMGFWRLYSK